MRQWAVVHLRLDRLTEFYPFDAQRGDIEINIWYAAVSRRASTRRCARCVAACGRWRRRGYRRARASLRGDLKGKSERQEQRKDGSTSHFELHDRGDSRERRKFVKERERRDKQEVGEVPAVERKRARGRELTTLCANYHRGSFRFCRRREIPVDKRR